MEKRSTDESLHNRTLRAAVSSLLIDKNSQTTVRGSHAEAAALASAVSATTNFHEELHRRGATVESIMKKFDEKSACASRFESMFGVRWPL